MHKLPNAVMLIPALTFCLRLITPNMVMTKTAITKSRHSTQTMNDWRPPEARSYQRARNMARIEPVNAQKLNQKPYGISS